MDPALQQLLDKQAITEVIARYSRTLDWLDDEGQATCYWPDAQIDYGFFSGTAADFLPVVMAIERQSQRRWLCRSIAMTTGTNSAAVPVKKP